MKKIKEELNAFDVIGLCVQSNNKIEEDFENSKIFPVVRRFVHDKIADQIPGRASTGVLYCGYTDYESDHEGEYTYFIGERVEQGTETPAGLMKITIPQQSYIKITSGPAPMPQVVKEPWQKIWGMTARDLGGQRSFKTDFEIYDERAADHSAIVMDIFVGIE